MVSIASFDVCIGAAENSIVLGCDVTSLGDQLMTFYGKGCNLHEELFLM